MLDFTIQAGTSIAAAVVAMRAAHIVVRQITSVTCHRVRFAYLALSVSSAGVALAPWWPHFDGDFNLLFALSVMLFVLVDRRAPVRATP